MECSTINLRVLAAAAAFASKDAARYYLNGVLIEIEPRSVTYVATDGSRMIVYRSEIDDPETPNNLLIGNFIIPTQQCKSYKLAKEDTGVAKIFGNGRLTIAHDFVDVVFAPIDGIYPDWRRILPRLPASGVLAQFNLKLLADFTKFAIAIEHASPFVAHNGPEAPAFVWFPGDPNCFGIVAPLKLTDEIGRAPPAWALSASNAEQGDLEDMLQDEAAE
jgi:DNA polymerase III beta subunit, central domain